MVFLVSLRLRSKNYLMTVWKSKSLTYLNSLAVYLEIKSQKITSLKRMRLQLDHQVSSVIKAKNRRHQMQAHHYSKTISRAYSQIQMQHLNSHRVSLEIKMPILIRSHSLMHRTLHNLTINHSRSLCLVKVPVFLRLQVIKMLVALFLAHRTKDQWTNHFSMTNSSHLASQVHQES